MTKRYIRLKELKPGLLNNYVPSDEYLINTKLQKNEIYLAKTNSDGNQDSIWGFKSENNVFLLGDSSVESIYLRLSMKPQSILERMLLENGFEYSVYNLGVSGSQTLNIVNLIINKLGNKPGSTLVVSIPSNDEGALDLKNNYFSDHWRYSSIVPAFNRISTRAEKIDYEPFEKNIKMIIALCDILNLKLFMTSIIYNGENTVYEKLNKIASEVCSHKKVPFINFEPVFKEGKDYFYDSLHLLPSGSIYYSEGVFDAINSTLVSNSLAYLSIYDICNDMVLTNTMIWSESIKLLIGSTIRVIIDADFPMDSSSKQMLLSIDYGKEDIQSELPKSENSEIGYFKYISAPAGKRVELLIDLKVPNGCDKIRFGLRSWKSQQVRVIKASVSVVNA